MTWPERFTYIKQRTGWSYEQLGQFFGRSISTVHGWAKGNQPMPDDVKAWIQYIEAALEKHDNRAAHKHLASRLLSVGILGAGALLAAWLYDKSIDDVEVSA